MRVKHTETLETLFLRSPIGMIAVSGNRDGVASVAFTDGRKTNVRRTARCLALESCRRELEEYFAGKRRTFSDVSVGPVTEFQKKVYDALHSIPAGKTISYGELAVMIGNPRAARAVGSALGSNPLAILLPCHRVVPISGKIGGFAWGNKRKKWLLDHEKIKFLPKTEQKSVS